MAGARLISTRLTVCPVCGHEARLIASTSAEVLSRCYACGDVTRTPSEVATSWAVPAALQARDLTGTSARAVPEREPEQLAG